MDENRGSEEVKDVATFILPDTMEEALWSIPSVSQYFLNRHVTKRGVTSVNLICPLVDLHELLTCCWKPVNVYETLPEELRDTSDFIHEFDAKVAYSLGLAQQRHITECLGMLLGTQPMLQLPPLVSTKKVTDIGAVFVVERNKEDHHNDIKWKHRNDFIRAGLAFGFPVYEHNSFGMSYQEMVDSLAQASVVVGIRSSATLIAAALGKTVMELTPEQLGHKQWEHKWESKFFQMTYGDLDDMDAIFIWERTRVMVEDIHKKEAARWERRSIPHTKVS